MLTESRKDVEDAQAVAKTREEVFFSKEAAAEERAAAAEGKARRWEKKAGELAASLRQKVKRETTQRTKSSL